MVLLLAVGPAFTLPNLMRSFADPLFSFSLVVHGRLLLLSRLFDRPAIRGVSRQQRAAWLDLTLQQSSCGYESKRGDLKWVPIERLPPVAAWSVCQRRHSVHDLDGFRGELDAGAHLT
jgi:hypothetical protein